MYTCQALYSQALPKQSSPEAAKAGGFDRHSGRGRRAFGTSHVQYPCQGLRGEARVGLEGFAKVCLSSYGLPGTPSSPKIRPLYSKVAHNGLKVAHYYRLLAFQVGLDHVAFDCFVCVPCPYIACFQVSVASAESGRAPKVHGEYILWYGIEYGIVYGIVYSMV